MKVLNRLQYALKHFGLHFLVGATITIGGHGLYTVSEELVELPAPSEIGVRVWIASGKAINETLRGFHTTLVAAFRRALHTGMAIMVTGMIYLGLTLVLCIASVRSNERNRR